MKKLMFGLTMAFAVTTVMADKWNDPSTGITWTYTTQGETVSLGDGYGSPAVMTRTAGDLVIPSTICDKTVTGIGDKAFEDCSRIKSVTIPPSVTSIGAYAFCYCRGLTSVTIPSSVTRIGDDAFEDCSGLKSFVVDAANPTYCSSNGLLCSKDGTTLIKGVNGNVTIPSSVTRIGANAFSGCGGLTSVTIPSGVIGIGDSAFRGCSGLTSVVIPEGVTSIGDYAFDNCYALRAPSSIGSGEFAEWVGLKSVTIPSSVTSIGKGAFYGCGGLTSVTIPPSVKCIGEKAFYRCEGLTSVTIPVGVTSIGDEAFNDCRELKVFHVSNNGDIETMMRLLRESGFDVNSVTFDRGNR